MKKSIVYLALAAVAIPALNSCKKGAEDPLSLKSRDSRITGTWELVSMDEMTTTSSTTTTTNDVNSDKYTETKDQKSTVSVNGGTKTETTEETKNTTNEYKQFSGGSFQSETDKTYNMDKTTMTYAYTVKVSIYKDNTYTATYTKGAVTTKNEDESSVNGGSVTGNNSSSTEEAGTTRTWTEEGTWTWADAKKDKVEINAGPLSGYLLRLAKDEVMISEKKDTEDSDVDVNEKSNITTYNNTTPSDKKDGLETTDYKETKSWTLTATWNKTDKESDRPE